MKWMVAGWIGVLGVTVLAAESKESVFIERGAPKLVLEDREETRDCKPGQWTRGPGLHGSRNPTPGRPSVFAPWFLGPRGITGTERTPPDR